MVETLHLYVFRNEGLESSRGSGFTRLVRLRSDHHCCVDVDSVSLACGGLRDLTFALATVEHAMRDKHTETYSIHRFNFMPF